MLEFGPGRILLMSGECNKCWEHTMDCNCMKDYDLLEEYDKIADTFDDFTQRMRAAYPHHGIFTPETLPQVVTKKIQDMGRAQQKLKSILDEDIFDSLSKHNPYWDAIDPDVSDKLDDLRRKFVCLNDNLWDLWAILHADHEDV